jgi:hypothetical protein
MIKTLMFLIRKKDIRNFVQEKSGIKLVRFIKKPKITLKLIKRKGSE